MEGAMQELERRSRFLSSLIRKKKADEVEVEEEEEHHDDKQQQQQHDNLIHDPSLNIKVRAADMPIPLQNQAFRCAKDCLDSMPNKKLDSKRLALALKKEFDSSYGPAWHCIVGTSFGSYVTHSLGGFIYFSISKVYVLLFRTAVEPLEK
ncbi:hypothetical protein MKX01_008386 [Papaver californicum]|nr:hypothetical protein MKX01_008386 [Papaver californicum]